MSEITTKKEALAAIQKTKPKETHQAETSKPGVEEGNEAPAPTSLKDFQLPELTHEFNAESPKKTRRRLPIQIMAISGVIFIILAFIHAVTSGGNNAPKPTVASNSKASIGMPEDDKDALIRKQAVQISELEQQFETGNVTNAPGQNKLSAVPQKPIVVPKAPSAKATTPKPPSAANRITRPIPVRRSIPQARPRPQPVAQARPPAPKPQPVAQVTPKPAASFSLSKQSNFAPEPVQPIQPKPVQPIKISTSHPVRRPINTKPIAKTPPPPPQGILVASLTGDLLKDNQAQSDSPTALYPASNSPLGKGLIAAGTKAKAKLDNPITWISQGSDAIIGQRYLLTLSEDLGAMAKKGSKVVAQVTSAEEDFVSMQVVEVNQQPIEHVDLTDESPQARKTPIAVIQYDGTPYLQAKLKGQGEGFGNKLLRAGLNAGIDQLRSSSVGDHASSVVNSLAPSRSGNSSRNGVYHFNKEVEIYFVEGV